MTTIRSAAADLHARWLERDARYKGRHVSDETRRLVHSLRSAELDELEGAALAASALTDLRASGTYRELLLILGRWQP